LQANYRKKTETTQYRFYVTDCIQNINASIAEQLGGKYMIVSYREIVKPQKEETRTGDEIRENIKEKLRNIGAE
jgi:hypothetical protein